jgi:hypothetical protein
MTVSGPPKSRMTRPRGADEFSWQGLRLHDLRTGTSVLLSCRSREAKDYHPAHNCELDFRKT